MRPGHALVLFSGGQDSTTCLAWALEHFAHVETIGFDYGQRHHIELQARRTVLASLRAGLPASAELAAVLAGACVVSAQVVSASLRWSVRRPFPVIQVRTGGRTRRGSPCQQRVS